MLLEAWDKVWSPSLPACFSATDILIPPDMDYGNKKASHLVTQTRRVVMGVEENNLTIEWCLGRIKKVA